LKQPIGAGGDLATAGRRLSTANLFAFPYIPIAIPACDVGMAGAAARFARGTLDNPARDLVPFRGRGEAAKHDHRGEGQWQVRLRY
jgi:hypothetical protein